MNLSEASIVDERAQTKLKDDEPINENNDIEDNNDQNCYNTLTGDCNKNVNEGETKDETKDFEEYFFFQIIFKILVDGKM